MHSYLRLICILCLLFGGLTLSAQKEEFDKFIIEKKYKDADKWLDKELSKTPNSAELNFFKWKMAGYLKLEAKEYFKYLNKAIELNPTYSEAYRVRGSFFLRMLRFEDAREDIESALKFADVDSLRKQALLTLSSYYLDTRKPEQVIETTLQILKMDSEAVGALNNLALGYQDVKKFNEALEVLYKIEKLEPKGTYIVINIGYVLTKVDQFEKAIEYFNRAEKMGKEEPLIYSNRAYAEYKLKDYSSAMTDINKSIKMFPTNSYAYRVRGLIYLDTKNTDKACEDFNTALAYKYTEMYDDDVKQLRDKYCIK